MVFKTKCAPLSECRWSEKLKTWQFGSRTNTRVGLEQQWSTTVDLRRGQQFYEVNLSEAGVTPCHVVSLTMRQMELLLIQVTSLADIGNFCMRIIVFNFEPSPRWWICCHVWLEVEMAVMEWCWFDQQFDCSQFHQRIGSYYGNLPEWPRPSNRQQWFTSAFHGSKNRNL